MNFRVKPIESSDRSNAESVDRDGLLARISRLQPNEVCAKLVSNPEGLSETEAAARLEKIGPNLIARERKATILEELWGRPRNPLNALLLTLAGTSYFLGDVRAAVVIGAMVVLAITTAFIQEHRSNEAAAKLRAMVHTTASVRRTPSQQADDPFCEIPMERLVPGDVVRLSAGDMIPAEVKVLTGDNEIIARKICHEVELDPGEILLGSKISVMSDTELADMADRTIVFAKLTPEQKERVVRALHARGHVVGFLGDGINDSPALKVADVGISVDTAVDIAKESADIILLEKSLLVLAEGVIEGRKVFANITKYIKMGASSNFGNMFSVLGASIFLPFLPMAPIQVLTNNLLYDFSQTTIPTDNVDEEYLATPRKWDIGNIFKFVIFIGPISSIFDYATYGMMLYVFDAWNIRRCSRPDGSSNRC
jgi:magnesium-transporting ATPase (P-type)